MAETQTETIQPLSEAPDFEKFKESRAKVRAGAAAVQPKAEVAESEKPSGTPSGDEPPVSETGKPSETAGVSETPKPQVQPQEKKPKRSDAEDRIKQLLAENAELKKKLEQPRPAVADVQPKATAPKAAEDPGNYDDFFAKLAKEEPKLSPGQIFQRYLEARDSHRDTQRDQAAQLETARRSFQETVQKARTDHPGIDPDDVFGTRDGSKPGIVLAVLKDAQGKVVDTVHGALQRQVPNWVDVLYHLHGNPAEYGRIGAIRDPHQQFFELSILGRQLAAIPAKPATEPEKPKLVPPVSKATRPPTILSGARDPGPEKTTADATDMRDFKAIRAAQRSRRAG